MKILQIAKNASDRTHLDLVYSRLVLVPTDKVEAPDFVRFRIAAENMVKQQKTSL